MAPAGKGQSPYRNHNRSDLLPLPQKAGGHRRIPSRRPVRVFSNFFHGLAAADQHSVTPDYFRV